MLIDYSSGARVLEYVDDGKTGLSIPEIAAASGSIKDDSATAEKLEMRDVDHVFSDIIQTFVNCIAAEKDTEKYIKLAHEFNSRMNSFFEKHPEASISFMMDLLKNTDYSDEDNSRIYITTLQVLGLSGNEKAIEITIKELLNDKSLYRMFAANVLGDTGKQNAVGYLKQVIQDIIDKEEYSYRIELIIESVTAMAKFGEHSMSSHILKIAQEKDPVKRV